MNVRRAYRMGLLCAALCGACDEGPGDGEDVEARAGELPDEAPNLPSADAQAAAAIDCGLTINADRELLVRALAVVEDPNRTTWNGNPAAPVSGAWHFGKLMTHMAGDNNPSDFVLEWLQTWVTAQTVNGQTVPARTAMQSIIDNWPRLSNGDLDLTQPPMRLLAIVNRMDLRDETRAGEGRFVFGVIDGFAAQFTVILEYSLPLEVMTTAEWAEAWHALGASAPGTQAYRTALQDITDAFSGPDAVPTAINGSAISQVRTNEIHLASPWELREFRLNTAGDLRQRTVALTPRNGFNGTARLRDFINANTEEILAGTHDVPIAFGGSRFRGGRVTNDIDFWSAAGINDPEARHLFSLNTCNGCHGAETSTGFLHVNPREAGQVASLSGFMTGIDVIDPADNTTIRNFNELARRADDLETVLCENL